jgi:hypothetical protein
VRMAVGLNQGYGEAHSKDEDVKAVTPGSER